MDWLAIAEGQAGLVTTRQLRECGMDRSDLERLARRSVLCPVVTGVYRLAGVPEDWRQELWRALLLAGPGAFACRRSAAGLWALDGFLGTTEVEVAVTTDRHPRRQRTVRLARVESEELLPVEGVPATSVALTLATLGAVAALEDVEMAVECALRRGLVRLAVLEQFARSTGHSGGGVLRAVLARRPAGWPPTESPAETRFEQISRAAGLPLPERQVRVVLGGRYCRLDHAWRAVRLAVEIDGREAHGPDRLSADLLRQNHALLDGWLILRFSAWTVLYRPDIVRQQTVRAYRLRALEVAASA